MENPPSTNAASGSIESQSATLPTNDPAPTQRIEDLYGMFPTVAGTTPSWTPNRFQNQFALDTTTGKWWYYDFKNKVWRSTGSAPIYSGWVVSNAAGSVFPLGWSITHNSTGNYTLTHNLGSANYVLTAIPLSGVAFIYAATPGTNSIVIHTHAFVAGSIVDSDQDFMFILTTQANP